jgi:iron complex transport system substrate-binding protein
VDKENALQAQVGVPVITLKSGADGVFDERFYGSMRLLGNIFQKEERAETIVSFIQKEQAEITKRTADIADSAKPSVYVCGLGNWGTTNHLMTASSYYPFMVAHIKNALSDETKGIHPIEEETFLALGETADILILDAAAVKNIKPLYAEDPTMFDTFKAWQEDEVYLEMAYNAYYTNYEIALINTWFLAKSVYPDYFSDVEMDAKTDEVTEMFLGKKLAEEIYALPQSFGGYQKIGTETFFD